MAIDNDCCVCSLECGCAAVTVSPGPATDEPDTDLETDRLLGQQRTDDHGYYDEKVNCLFSKDTYVQYIQASNGHYFRRVQIVTIINCSILTQKYYGLIQLYELGFSSQLTLGIQFLWP